MQKQTKELIFKTPTIYNVDSNGGHSHSFYYFKKHNEAALVIHETSVVDAQSRIRTNESFMNLPTFMMIKDIPQAAKDKLQQLQQIYFQK